MAVPGVMQRFLGAIGVSRLLRKVQTPIVAATTQTQAAATQLSGALCVISTCANSGDGVKLPPIQAGLEVVVINRGAQTVRVYSLEASGVTIGATAGATGITLAANKVAIFFAGTAIRWDEMLTA